jgi:glycosyltransferase involved in cell wall biosynthesis
VRERLPPRIDAIHVEQPWLWPVARKIKELPAYRAAILIYGSANIEAELKREIFASYRVQGADDVIEAIDALERTAAREADLVLAVTGADLATLERYGAKQLLLAPNGSDASDPDPDALARWRARLPKAPWILYVASAHPPNFTGFIASVGDSLGCIPPDSRLVVAGSVCEHLYRAILATRWHSLSCSRLELVGAVSDADLAALKALAHAFLLPIQHGGGSNIKTAEALYSGAYVICSEAALRGFEAFACLPEVVVARSPREFQAGMRDVLQRPPRVLRRPARDDVREGLRWDVCLAPLPEAAMRMKNRERA